MSDGKKIDDGGLALPSLRENDNPSMPLIASGFGMTLREYYAGQAMKSAFGSMREGWNYDAIARECRLMADALIAALKVTP